MGNLPERVPIVYDVDFCKRCGRITVDASGLCEKCKRQRDSMTHMTTTARESSF